jgi:CubicO group peptidase (beta-lactamase class C family)
MLVPSGAERAAGWLDDLVARGEISAGVGLVGTSEKVLWRVASGFARPHLPAGPETVFDYGSLTKPLVTTLALLLAERGELRLESTLGRMWRGSAPLAPSLRDIRLSSLLRHRSGFRAWTPLAARCRNRLEVERTLLDGSLLKSPGTELYSDLGYLVWSRVAEKATGRSLASLLREEVLCPLELTSVVEAPGDQESVASTLCDGQREVELAREQGFLIPDSGPPTAGQPLDGNARFLLASGWGLPAHAGLFGTAEDLWRLGAEWLRPQKLLKQSAVAAALRGGRRFACGWWRRRRTGGGAGEALSRSAFGSTGFPGGNLWIDPERDRVVILLAHRTSSRSDMNRSRRQFNALALHTTTHFPEEGDP